MRGARTLGLALLLVLSARHAAAQTARVNYCALFTATAVAKLLGTPVRNGTPLLSGLGCQWIGQDGRSSAIIAAIGTDDWCDPRGAPGYEALSSVGKRAYSHPEGDVSGQPGWSAKALTDRAMVTVKLSGTTASRASAVALLRQFVARL